MIFLLTLICLIVVIIIIFINSENRGRNIFFSLLVFSVLLAFLAQHSLIISDSAQVNYLSLFDLNRQALANFNLFLYIISLISLIGYLYFDNDHR